MVIAKRGSDAMCGCQVVGFLAKDAEVQPRGCARGCACTSDVCTSPAPSQVLEALEEIAFQPEFLPNRIEKERKAVMAEAQVNGHQVVCSRVRQRYGRGTAAHATSRLNEVPLGVHLAG
jgi:hypothetical protein